MIIFRKRSIWPAGWLHGMVHLSQSAFGFKSLMFLLSSFAIHILFFFRAWYPEFRPGPENVTVFVSMPFSYGLLINSIKSQPFLRCGATPPLAGQAAPWILVVTDLLPTFDFVEPFGVRHSCLHGCPGNQSAWTRQAYRAGLSAWGNQAGCGYSGSKGGAISNIDAGLFHIITPKPCTKITIKPFRSLIFKGLAVIQQTECMEICHRHISHWQLSLITCPSHFFLSIEG